MSKEKSSMDSLRQGAKEVNKEIVIKQPRAGLSSYILKIRAIIP